MSRSRTEGPTLRALFSSTFSRSSPMVEADSPTVTAASWLRFHLIEAALVLMRNLEPMRMGTKHLFLGR